MDSKIPIQNVYYLLCYAWNKLEEADEVSIAASDCKSLPDLFARVLISGTKRMIRGGFDRDYIPHYEETARLRGRIAFSQSIKATSWLRGRMVCEFSELSHDILHNQILKTTLRSLQFTEAVESEQRGAISGLLQYLDQVRTIPLTSRLFHQVQLHGNNRGYRFLLNVCEIVYECLLPSEKAGDSKFRDFLREEKQMAGLFEEFVRNFYRNETSYKVSAMKLKWQGVEVEEPTRGFIPEMRTDVTLESPCRKIILGCKFYKDAFKGQHEPKFSSSNLYQLYSYLKNKEHEIGWERCEGVLLYPTTSTKFDHQFILQNHPIRLVGINLNQD